MVSMKLVLTSVNTVVSTVRLLPSTRNERNPMRDASDASVVSTIRNGSMALVEISHLQVKGTFRFLLTVLVTTAILSTALTAGVFVTLKLVILSLAPGG